MPHLVLLGDSIFDNAAYTSGGPDVVSQVRRFLPSEWGASLLAIDGSTTDNVAGQVQGMPKEATHLVLSVGGNNALMQASKLGISFFGIPGTSSAKALESLADISDDFETRYRSAVDACLRPGLPLSVCTIYNGCFLDETYRAHRLCGAGGFQRRNLKSGNRKRACSNRPAPHLCRPSGLCQPHRTLLYRRREDCTRDRRHGHGVQRLRSHTGTCCS